MMDLATITWKKCKNHEQTSRSTRTKFIVLKFFKFRWLAQYKASSSCTYIVRNILIEIYMVILDFCFLYLFKYCINRTFVELSSFSICIVFSGKHNRGKYHSKVFSLLVSQLYLTLEVGYPRARSSFSKVENLISFMYH